MKQTAWNQPPTWDKLELMPTEEMHKLRHGINRNEAKQICRERRAHTWVRCNGNIFSTDRKERILFVFCTTCGSLHTQWVHVEGEQP